MPRQFPGWTFHLLQDVPLPAPELLSPRIFRLRFGASKAFFPLANVSKLPEENLPAMFPLEYLFPTRG